MDDATHYHDHLLKYNSDWDISIVHGHNLDVKANHIYLFGDERYSNNSSDPQEPGVEFAMANTFIRNINILMRKSHEPILCHMKTMGGFWDQGMAIFDTIRACPNPITILAYSDASSMSSIIFQAPDKRVMMPHTRFMFHGGGSGMFGTTKQILTEAEELKKITEIMISIYVDSMKKQGSMSKKSKDFIAGWLREQMNLKEEVYLDAHETVKLGLADAVFGTGGYDWPSLLTY